MIETTCKKTQKKFSLSHCCNCDNFKHQLLFFYRCLNRRFHRRFYRRFYRHFRYRLLLFQHYQLFFHYHQQISFYH